MVTGTLIGPCNFLTVGNAAAQIEMNAEDGAREKLQLWTETDSVIPDRVTQSMWVAMCRESLIHGNELVVTTESVNSAQVASIMMNPVPGR